MEFFGDGCSADLRSAFEHQRLEARLRQIEGGDQSVVTAADDDDVALSRPWLGRSLDVFQNSSAARRPVAPMMPPPGCVADPHM